LDWSNPHSDFQGKESEQNWHDREGAMLRVRGMLKDEAHLRYPDTFSACLKENFIQWSLKTVSLSFSNIAILIKLVFGKLVSLRTTVAVNTCLLYTELAMALGTALDPFCETLLTNLLRMAGITKKITAQHTQSTVSTIITHCSVQPRVIFPLLWHTLQEKTYQARAYGVDHLKLYMETHGQRLKASIESTGGLELLEKSVKRALADANPAVRESARVCFWVFEGVWKERGRVIFESLDATARKQLEKACPNPETTSIAAPVQKLQSKKSVAAAIAASRAKAKALAAAPRHQATHPAQPISQNSPSTPLPAGPSSQRNAPRPLSPKTRSPPISPRFSPRSRIPTSPKAWSPLILPGVTTPPHPSSDGPTPLRRSRLASHHSGDSFRVAVQTALPDSPPHTPIASRPRSDDITARMSLIPALEADRARPSIALSELNGEDDLLMPSTIPLPEDSESEIDEPIIHHLSFTLPLAPHKLPAPSLTSQARSVSPKSVLDDPNPTLPNAPPLISTPVVHPPIVEDAMRARAEQAESAAERLLELVDPEEEAIHHSPIPPSLLVGSGASKATPVAVRSKVVAHPVTPPNRTTDILKQAAMFADSPVQSRKSASLLSALTDRKQETGWWLKRMNCARFSFICYLSLNSERS
jgi:CLIP-associating protein 1/2